MSKFPISAVCPQCGGKEYTKRAPQTFVAFASDRVCKACQTRYSPPAPLWGGVMLLLAAPILGVLGLVLIALLFGPFTLLGLLCDGALGLFALVVFIGGIRTVIESSQGSEPMRPGAASKS